MSFNFNLTLPPASSWLTCRACSRQQAGHRSSSPRSQSPASFRSPDEISALLQLKRSTNNTQITTNLGNVKLRWIPEKARSISAVQLTEQAISLGAQEPTVRRRRRQGRRCAAGSGHSTATRRFANPRGGKYISGRRRALRQPTSWTRQAQRRGPPGGHAVTQQVQDTNGTSS